MVLRRRANEDEVDAVVAIWRRRNSDGELIKV
jgi:hypothetical protein